MITFCRRCGAALDDSVEMCLQCLTSNPWFDQRRRPQGDGFRPLLDAILEPFRSLRWRRRPLRCPACDTDVDETSVRCLTCGTSLQSARLQDRSVLSLESIGVSLFLVAVFGLIGWGQVERLVSRIAPGFRASTLAPPEVPVLVQGHEGRLVSATMHSTALEKNLLGDPAEVRFTVYLPPSYEGSPAKRYPVVYLLHGNGGNERSFIDGSYQGLNMKTAMDAAIKSGSAREFIIVMPGSNTRYSGSHYVNSSVSGRWADAITRELVEHVDRTYRTITWPDSRGLAGYSMGGRGTFFLAATVPGVYGAIYALSPGTMAFESFPPVDDATWRRVLTSAGAAQVSPGLRRAMGFAVAYSPNPSKPPLLADFPVELRDGHVRRSDSVWARWMAHDPIALIPGRAENLRLLRSIHYSCGTDDPLLPQNRLMAEQLRKAGLTFTNEEYAGNHTSKIREQIETRVIPMFSSSLVFK